MRLPFFSRPGSETGHPEPPPLDSAFLEQLEKIHLVYNRLAQHRLPGIMPSNRRGRGFELVDYRTYIPGDDLRLLDWNAYLRLDRLIVRVCQEERSSSVLVLLDSSRSMKFGTPSKWGYSIRAAAALGYVALLRADQLRLGVFDERIRDLSPDFRGSLQATSMLDYLRSLKPGERGTSFSGLFQDLPELCSRQRHNLVVVLSDLLTDDFQPAVSLSASDLFFLQILSGDEVRPSIAAGDYELVDSESESLRTVSWSIEAHRSYNLELNRFLAHIEALFAQRGWGYARCLTEQPFERVVLDLLHAKGLVQ